MNATPRDPRRLFVLDTNVLMHDPTALFRFKEHDVFLPMVVLEELDHGKKGVSEVARNVRQVSRFIDELTAGASHEAISAGLPLQVESLSDSTLTATGRLFLPDPQPVGQPPRLPSGVHAGQRYPCHRPGPEDGVPGVAGYPGLQGHQPAHQGGGDRPACRGLLQ